MVSPLDDYVRDVHNVTRDAERHRPPVSWEGMRGTIVKVSKPAVSAVVRFADGREIMFTYRAALNQYRAFPADPARDGLRYA